MSFRVPSGRMPLLVVWTTWIICVSIAAVVIWRQSPRLPYSDDWNMVPFITGEKPVTLKWLWDQLNEHRIVIPKLMFVFTARHSGGNFSTATFVNLLVLAGAA